MTYEQKCELLGIKRPDSLAKRFGEAMPSVAVGKEYISHKPTGPRVDPPPGPDLSHLNPPCGRERAQHTRRWWKSLSAEEKQKLATKRGAKYEGRNYQKNWWSPAKKS